MHHYLAKDFKLWAFFRLLGIKTGVLIMPTLPYITDTEENIIDIVKQARSHDANFVFSSFGVTLRDRQRQYFYNNINPDIQKKYIDKYKNYYQCTSPNYRKLKTVFTNTCREFGISTSMPSYAKDTSVTQLSFFK